MQQEKRNKIIRRYKIHHVFITDFMFGYTARDIRWRGILIEQLSDKGLRELKRRLKEWGEWT